MIGERSASFDVFVDRPLGRLISGDGLLRIFICRKREAAQGQDRQ